MACECSTPCCSTCNCTPCQCGGTSVRPAPSPYYNQAGSVQETHCQSVVQQFFATAIASSTDFVMPACNYETVIKFPNLTQMQIGSYLWNNIAGYLLVTAFNYASHEVIVKNECLVGNIAPGTVLPRCTIFNVVGAPYGLALSNSVITAAGNVLANATPINSRLTFVDGADGVKGVKLPINPSAGQEFIIYNTYALDLFLYAGEAADSLNGVSGGVAITMPALTGAWCHSRDVSTWWVGLMV